jgi:hypothetical protein
MIFGRGMSKKEAKELEQTLVLGGEGLVPVFDAYNEREKLERMSKDKIKNKLRSIGVSCPQRIVYFEIPREDAVVGPVRQTNGFREYKFPAGTRVEPLDTLRL